MNVVIDIEANSLNNPTKIWLIVCKDIDTSDLHIFRDLIDNDNEVQRFKSFSKGIGTLVGHNLLGYDLPNLSRLIGYTHSLDHCIDTLVLSKLTDYSREGGHSIEQYGKEFGLPKYEFSDWTKWSQQMEDYCVRDVEICSLLYDSFAGVLSDPLWVQSIKMEHAYQCIVNRLHDNGYGFDRAAATKLLQKVEAELGVLDKEILKSFPPKTKLIREVHPQETKYGTLHKKDFKFLATAESIQAGIDLSDYNGGHFSRFVWEPFNPSSHKQVIDVLHTAGWKPIDKTEAHKDYLRNKTLDNDKLVYYNKYGWRINENNLGTLPGSAPKPARTLAQRILLESRRRTLTEWTGLLGDDDRIHGQFYGLGAWTHRMAHQRPNTANIPTGAKLYGKDMRALWRAPKRRLLVGVDAEGIQLRIFAHYINDKEFTEALVTGRKENESDPHNLNKRVLGSVCKSRQDAKRFIYALLLGAGITKLAEVLGCKVGEARAALNRLLQRYTGWQYLRDNVIPVDARKGYFVGLDGRRTKIPGNTVKDREHLCMSGYLQNGEAIVIKKTILAAEGRIKEVDPTAIIVDVVHDEIIYECKNNMAIANRIGEVVCEEMEKVGVELKLLCPLKGEAKVGLNWKEIH